MPKTRLDAFHKSPDPPVDWLWAAILERKAVRGYDLKHMAQIAGVSYEYMRKLIVKPPHDWPYGALQNICKEFGIKMVPSVNGSVPSEVFKE